MHALGFITTPRGQQARDAMFTGGTTNPSKRAAMTQQARPVRRPPTEAQAGRTGAAPAGPGAGPGAGRAGPGAGHGLAGLAGLAGAGADAGALSGDALLQRRCEYLEAQVRRQAGQLLDCEVILEGQRGHTGWMQARVLHATTEWCPIEDGTDNEAEPPAVLDSTLGNGGVQVVATGALVSLCYPMRRSSNTEGGTLVLMRRRAVDAFSGALSVTWLMVSRTLGEAVEQRVGEFVFAV